MKYATYIQSLSRTMKSITPKVQYIAATTRSLADQLRQNDIYGASVAAHHSDYHVSEAERTCDWLNSIAEFMTASKAFVEKQPQGLTAWEIGEKWVNSKKERQGE